jgi:hypothetical protein
VLFLAEVPFGPICTNEVLTFAIASPLHWSLVATVIPPAVAPNAKDNGLRWAWIHPNSRMERIGAQVLLA